MRSNKKILSIALAVSVLGGVSACGGDSKDDAKHKNATQSAGSNRDNTQDNDQGNSKKDSGKLDTNAVALQYKQYPFQSNNVSLASIRTDPIWASKGKLAASSGDILVTSNDANNEFYGLNVKNGSKAWEIKTAELPGIKDLKNMRLETGDVGDKFMLVWYGESGGDALNSAQKKTYVKVYNIKDGSLAHEKDYNYNVEFSELGNGYKIDDGTTNANNNVNYFGDSGFTNKFGANSTKLDETLRKLYPYSYNSKLSYGGGVNYINSKFAIAQLTQRSDSGPNTTYGQVFNIETQKPVGDKFAIGSNYHFSTVMDAESPSGNYMIMGGHLLKVGSNGVEVVRDLSGISKQGLSFMALSDDGEIFATAAASGPIKWVLIGTDGKAKILDDYNGRNDGDILYFNKNNIVLDKPAHYDVPSDPGQLWTGNFVTFERK